MPSLAVIIATKNRSREIAWYALASLNRSGYRDFVCLVWDASGGGETQAAAQRGWNFPLEYHRAPRPGSASQRNDAARYALQKWPSLRGLLFMDDDSELSPDALEGVARSLDDPQVWGVNIPNVPALGAPPAKAGSRTVSPWLHNWASGDLPGIEVDWLGGCGMAFRREAFEAFRFPEAFQRFGGYALGEDMALSFYLKKKRNKKLVNARFGSLCHHVAPGGRPDAFGMAASKWHNFHLLFEALYGEAPGVLLKGEFKLFMAAAALKCLVRAKSLNPLPVLRGIGEARRALKEFHRNGDIRELFTALPREA